MIVRLSSMSHLSRLCFSLLSVACLSLTACSKSGSPGSGETAAIKLGFIVKQPEEPWFQLEWKFADQAAKEFGFELIKIGAPDGDKVLSAIDNLAASGAQGFVICTPDARLGPAIASMAKQRNLKLIAVDDRFIDGNGEPMADVHYLGISARKIGESVGAALHAELAKRQWTPADTAVCAVTFDQLDTDTLQKWSVAIEENLPVLPYKFANGQPPPQRVGGADIPAAYTHMLGISEQSLNSALGIHEASLGEQGDEKSDP